MAAKSQIAGLVNYNPAKDVPSLDGKVIFITGGRYPSGSGPDGQRY